MIVIRSTHCNDFLVLPTLPMASTARIRRIFHPTDLRDGSVTAFFHALRLTVAAPATLTILHVASERDEVEMGSLPHVRDTLVKWGIITDGTAVDELTAMRIGVHKVVVDDAPVQACLDHLDHHPTDLIVLHTTQRAGRSTWLAPRVSEPLMRSAGELTLLVPEGVPGFVVANTGEVRLRRFLIPLAAAPAPQQSVDMAAGIADLLEVKDAEFHLLHVGDDGDMPRVHTPERKGWRWIEVTRNGPVVDTILQLERDLRPDLLVMTTQGHDGFLDALRGSTTERVLRHIRCPLLTAVSK